MTAEMLEESFMAEAYIVAAARTAGGRRGGRLSGWHPAELAAQVIDALIERTNADPALVEDVIMGCVLQAGEQSGCIGRMAVLASKLPKAVPGVTIDRQCGSSQQAVHFAAQAVMSGTMDCVIAAGVESMSRIPMAALSKIYKDAGLGHFMIPQEEVDTHRLHHVLTRAVGTHDEALVGDFHHVMLEEGDRLLVCSDGLTDMSGPQDILAVLHRFARSELACKALVDLANERGGRDNVTVIVAGFSAVS
jgi:hypothetical protein